jgi:hypothetical protein
LSVQSCRRGGARCATRRGRTRYLRAGCKIHSRIALPTPPHHKTTYNPQNRGRVQGWFLSSGVVARS